MDAACRSGRRHPVKLPNARVLNWRNAIKGNDALIEGREALQWQ
jgi:hypothetical protein